MNCDCLKPLFDADPRPDGFAETVDRLKPSCQCERGAVSCNSVGQPVEDNEVLVRFVLIPKHVGDRSGDNIDDNIITGAGGFGLSVHRERDPIEIQDAAAKAAQSQAASVPIGERVELWGVIRVRAGDIRARRLFNGAKACCIYETPDLDAPSHADVLLAASQFPSNRKRRLYLIDLLRELRLNGAVIRAEDYDFADLSGIVFDGSGPSP